MIKKLLEQFSPLKINKRLFYNPFINFEISSLSNYQGVNIGIKRNTPIVVSIWAEADDYQNLPLTLYSLLNQTMKPDRLILWLSNNEDLQSLPYEITQFIKNGLEIQFVRDLQGYTTTFYAIKNIPQAINITAENGLYYNDNWLKKLYDSYIIHPDEIQVHLADKVKFDDKKILPSKFWDKSISEETSSYSFIINPRGGVLYPPNCFGSDFLREDIFSKYSPVNQELWIWTMSLVYGRKIRVVKNHIKNLHYLDIIQLFNEKSDFELIDKQLENLMKFYRQNIINKLF